MKRLVLTGLVLISTIALAQEPVKTNVVLRLDCSDSVSTALRAHQISAIRISGSTFGIFDTYFALILTYMVFTLPYAILLMTGFLNTLPRYLDEAVLVDGGSSWTALWRVIVPLSVPGIVATAASEFLADPQNIQRGRGVWQTRCQFCHGKMAYPGKAPKLDPSRYTPAFVYDRVANGFQGMPPWRQEFSVEELKSVVAYVLSREFPN